MKAGFTTESIFYWIARGISFTAWQLPARWNVGIGSWIGRGAYHLLPRRRALALGNLRAAFGGAYTPSEYRQILKGMFENLGMIFMEVARIPRVDRAYVDRWVEVAPGSRQRLDQALQKGRGMIFVTAHFGNWELGSISGALLGYPTLVLAREQGWPRLNRLLNQYRESKGCRVVTKGFPIRELIRGLEQGRIVGILADQDGGRNGVLAPFFGRLASTAPGTIALSISTGAPVLPIFLVRRKGPAHTLIVEEPLEIPAEGSLGDRMQAGIRAYLAVLERHVRRHPNQWLWLHRRWKSTPERRALLLSDGKSGHLTQLKACVERIEQAWEGRAQGDKRLRGPHHSLFHLETIQISYRNRFCRGLLSLLAAVVPRRWPHGDPWLKRCLAPESYEALRKAYADLSLSCGAATAPVNLLWAWGIGAKSIHITRSRLPSWRRFHLAIVPEHDLPRTFNVVCNDSGVQGEVSLARRKVRGRLFLTDGALTPLPKEEAAQRQRWREHLGPRRSRRIGLLLGGPAKGVDLDLAQVQQLFPSLLKACESMDAEILVTTSRRTPIAVEHWMKETLKQNPRCRLLVLVNCQETGGLAATSEAIPCILGEAEVLVVSGDSISMVSEALARSKPVVSFLPRRRPFSFGESKYHRFLRGLSAKGRISLSSPDRVGETVVQLIGEGSRVKGQGEGPPPSTDSLVKFLTKWL